MNTIKHLNDSHNKPLCQKENWIETGDSLMSSDALKNNNCEECNRIYLKEKRKGRDKTKTYVYSMRELVKVWADEMDEMIDNGLDPHHWTKFPKTQEFVKTKSFLDREKFAFFIDDLLGSIEPTFCKHENLDIDEEKKRETCKDCECYRIWWFKTDSSDNEFGWNRNSEKVYGSWTWNVEDDEDQIWNLKG